MTLVFVALLGATYWVYTRVPTGFVPDEDQGYIFILIQAPHGRLARLHDEHRQAGRTASCRRRRRCSNVFGVGGFSFGGSAPNPGMMFVMLKDFDERPGDEHCAKAVVGRLFGAFSQITGATVIPFLPPSINGLGTFGGFQYELLDQRGGPIEDLAARRSS